MLINRLKNEMLLFDGAMGTMLEGAYKSGELPEILNITNPDLITRIHKQYVAAGSDIITANTFGANALKLKATGYSADEIIAAAIKNAKAAGAPLVALDIGPLGQLLKPAGTLGFENAVSLFAEQILAGTKHGASLILIETMSDLYEIKAAVIAAKECSTLPVIASLTFDKNLHTFMGCDARTAVTFLNAIGVDAIGVNCCQNPFDIAPIIDVFTQFSRPPVLVMPNAGLPDASGGYSVLPKQFADALTGYYKKGVSLFGGCCGTTPEYIAQLKKSLKGKKPIARQTERITAVTSGNRTAVIDGKITVIGERINPTGKPKLKEAIKKNDIGFIIGEAVAQQDAGADILDVNCGLPDIDEAAAIARVTAEIQSVVNLPLQIDSVNPKAIESGVRIYNGKPLINSVSGEKKSMASIFPIAKKYGAAVIGLTLDENGIPDCAEQRFLIAKRIVKTAASYGIPKEEILIDSLVLTASAQQEQVFETIKTIRLVKERLGVNTVLGVSNVSFGLPNRAYLNSIFLTAAMSAGLSSAIVNPLSEEISSAIKAFRVLSGSDKGAADYIAAFSAVSESKASTSEAVHKDLTALISSGQREASKTAIRDLLTTAEPLVIMDTYLIPALDFAGKQYETGKIYLPQLIQAAETAKGCFDVINKVIKTEAGTCKGKIILATVKGDVHDIGKNIVKVLLQSYGYEIIDLGKDVDGDFVASEAAKNRARLVGLSALMTTTIPAMRQTIEKIRISAPQCKVMVGGAVLNEEYAKLVGADYYAPDAMAGVKIAEAVLGKKIGE
ncbi:MAG: homocysteine S-methyltransferase family protein [Firmicutes bacterium]|nr:homocysteine S-methyltransferase family protein [Bacillota bacterium]